MLLLRKFIDSSQGQIVVDYEYTRYCFINSRFNLNFRVRNNTRIPTYISIDHLRKTFSIHIWNNFAHSIHALYEVFHVRCMLIHPNKEDAYYISPDDCRYIKSEVERYEEFLNKDKTI